MWGPTGSKRTVFATFVKGYVWVDEEDGVVLSLDSFIISLAMCRRRSASLQFHWYSVSSVGVECGIRSPSIMVLLPPGRNAPPREGPITNRVLSSMGCVQKVPLTWATPAVIMHETIKYRDDR